MDILSSIAEEEYTGRNRCWPCTLVNAALVGAFALWLLVRKRQIASLAVTVIGAGLIYLRGYVVPYTPTFAPRLAAASPLPDDLFHDAAYEPVAEERESLVETDVDGETVLEEMVEAGIVVPDGETLTLSADVDDVWHEEMARLAAYSIEDLATEIERDVPTIDDADTLESDGNEWVVLGANDVFLARQIAIGELAAYRVLGPYLDDEAIRLTGSRSLLMFLDECPLCGTPVVEGSEADNCCGAYAAPGDGPDDILACPNCEQRLFTFPSE